MRRGRCAVAALHQGEQLRDPPGGRGRGVDRRRLQAAAAEVARLLPVRLADLADPGNLRLGTRWRGDLPCDVPYFEVGNERVWGATAMVLAELLAVLDLGPRDPW